MTAEQWEEKLEAAICDALAEERRHSLQGGLSEEELAALHERNAERCRLACACAGHHFQCHTPDGRAYITHLNDPATGPIYDVQKLLEEVERLNHLLAMLSRDEPDRVALYQAGYEAGKAAGETT